MWGEIVTGLLLSLPFLIIGGFVFVITVQPGSGGHDTQPEPWQAGYVPKDHGC